MKKKGFMLVMCLLILAVVLVAGLGLLGSQAAKYRSSQRVVQASQAKALALAGMEDARVKLAKDVRFPPKRNKDKNQFIFSYAEDLRDPNATPPADQLGYTVFVDYQLEREVFVQGDDNPVRYGLYRITTIGLVGPRGDPYASRVMYAEFDIVAGHFVRFEDRGSL
ncbi:MAG: hypothetical protein AB7S38_22845 [Vulcanimicrobiota bacterium]